MPTDDKVTFLAFCMWTFFRRLLAELASEQLPEIALRAAATQAERELASKFGFQNRKERRANDGTK